MRSKQLLCFFSHSVQLKFDLICVQRRTYVLQTLKTAAYIETTVFITCNLMLASVNLNAKSCFLASKEPFKQI